MYEMQAKQSKRLHETSTTMVTYSYLTPTFEKVRHRMQLKNEGSVFSWPSHCQPAKQKDLRSKMLLAGELPLMLLACYKCKATQPTAEGV